MSDQKSKQTNGKVPGAGNPAPEMEDETLTEATSELAEVEPMDKMVNLNTASVDRIRQIPGVGKGKAESIVANRPFTTLDELKKIRGISPALVERMRQSVVLSGDEEPPVSENEEPASMALIDEEAAEEMSLSDYQPLEPVEAEVVGETPLEEIEDVHEEAIIAAAEDPQAAIAAMKADEPAIPLPTAMAKRSHAMEAEQSASAVAAIPAIPAEEPEPAKEESTAESPAAPKAEAAPIPAPAPKAPPSQPKPETQSQPQGISWMNAFWLVAGSSLLSMVLAVLFTLAVLGVINGGLSYVAPADLDQVSQGVTGLEMQTEALSQDLDGLQTRITGLEALSGRVDAVEESTTVLEDAVTAVNTDIQTIQMDLDNIQLRFDEVQTSIEALRRENGQFMNFFDGLESLLSEVFSPAPEVLP